MWQFIVESYKDFSGTGMLLTIFLIALIYLIIVEKRKDIKIILGWIPLAILILFLCPVFAQIIYRVVGDEIYYRLLWLLPITILIAYLGTKIVVSFKGTKRITLIVAMVAVIVLSGDYAYDNEYYSKAENIYHVPQSVVEICDMIHIDGREVMAAFPIDLVQYVRQYDATICMPFGRENSVAGWGIINELSESLQTECIDAQVVSELARQYQCHYIVIPKDKEVEGRFDKYGYIIFGETDDYDILVDKTFDPTTTF